MSKRTIQNLKTAAFTLAETLIVIGIIGVVAALTLPNLNHATGDKEKVTKVKKIYSALTDAIDRAQVVYGDFDTWFNDGCDSATCSERFAKRVTEFMKISKDCGFDEGCFSNAPLLLHYGTEQGDADGYFDDMYRHNAYMVTTSDGMSLAFRSFTPGNFAYFKINIDIDGPNKGKNQEGNDIFDFSIYIDKENYWGADVNLLYPSSCPHSRSGNNVGNNETAWVIENGNLDYLRCPDELNWETQTSCK